MTTEAEDRSFLTIGDAVALSTVLGYAQRCARVTWLVPGTTTITEGVARHIVRDPDDAYFLGNQTDVRDGYLRISGMVETFLPVRDVMRMVGRGEFAEVTS